MKKHFLFAAILSLMASLPAYAHSLHTDFSSLSSSFFNGVLHPILGLDHLLMLAAVGLLVAHKSARKMQFKLSLFALTSLVLGLVAGYLFGRFSGIETGIILSLIVSMVAILSLARTSSTWSNRLTVLCFCLLTVHGYAHGIESTSHIIGFGLGMLTSASTLILVFCKLGNTLYSRWASLAVAAGSLAVLTLS